MKKIRLDLFVGTIILIGICLSCNETKSEQLPEVLVQDTLVQSLDYKIVDTFNTGEPRKIKFYDADDSTNTKYEKHFYKTGQLCIEGPLDENNLRHGTWRAWYDCGKLWSEGDFVHGMRNGESKVYSVNGNLQYYKEYRNDTAVGIWRCYAEDGKELLQIYYENGVVVKQIQLTNDSTKSPK